MFKKYFTIFLAVAAIQGVAFAEDAVFSSSEPEQFTLQPLSFEKPEIEAPAVETTETTTATSATEAPAPTVQPSNSALSNENYLNAINNLDNAQVELREQIANYNALMSQAKSEYEAKKQEYNNYKKIRNEFQRKMKNVETSKKKIQENVGTVQTN